MSDTTIQRPPRTPSFERPSPAYATEELAAPLLVDRMRLQLARYLAPLRRRWRSIFGIALIAGAVAVGGSFLLKVVYDSSFTFYVDAATHTNLPSGLASITRAIGMGGDDEGRSLDFFAWLATSDAVLRAVLADSVPANLQTRPDLGPQFWGQLFGKPMPADPRQFALGVQDFKRMIATKIDGNAGTVTVTVGAGTRELAIWAADRIFKEMNVVNTVRRRTQATNELQFLRSQEADASRALTDADGQLTQFLQDNRQPTLPPVLRNEEERLRRKESMALEAYTTLTKSREDAEIRAVRDVPALSMAEGPTFPINKSRPKRGTIGFGAFLLAAVICYGIALATAAEPRRA